MSITKDIKRVAKQTATRTSVLIPPFPWDKDVINEGDSKSEEVVVMLHGLWRSVRAMQPLANHLNKSGYTTINMPYPSFRYDLEDLAHNILHRIRLWLDKGKKIHFVTHSLGGVVLRKVIEMLEPQDLSKVGRVVMLAPPHQGSEIIDWLGESPLKLFKGVLGPASNFLSTKYMSAEKAEFCSDIDALIIMGDKSSLPFFRTLLEDSNDGIVSVEKGRLLGTNYFKIIEADHTFISSNSKVMDTVSRFIRIGKI